MIISSCNDNNINPVLNPEACFTLSKSTYEIGDELIINNCSNNSESYKWQINGLDISDSFTPDFYSFDSSGMYTIKLIATSNDGKSNTLTKTVTVVNQYLKYAGTWDVNETEDNNGVFRIDKVCIFTVDNKGYLRATNYPPRFPRTVIFTPPHITDTQFNTGVIIISGANMKLNASLEFNQNANIEFIGGNSYYFSNDVNEFNSSILGIKR